MSTGDTDVFNGHVRQKLELVVWNQRRFTICLTGVWVSGYGGCRLFYFL